MKRGDLAEDEDAIPTRYSLLSRLQRWDDQQSWKDFFDTYWAMIRSLALKSGLRESEADDVVQETVICVAKDIHKFKRDPTLGSFKGWLRNIIRWRIADQFRKRSRDRRNDTEGASHPTPDIAEIADPASDQLESLWQEEWEANLFRAALARVKKRVKEEHYQIFHLHVNKGWSVQQVARAMNTRIGQVYLIKHRISLLVKKEIQRLNKKPI
jgi:RNA polymerase sigma factor (sigma-70 family)